MMSSTSEQYDAKKFPLCAPWDGQRGKSYQETFIPNMKSSWGLRGDDFANKQEHLTGNVPGGIPITTPAQRLANNLAVNARVAHVGTANDIRKSEGCNSRTATLASSPSSATTSLASRIAIAST